jgi:hypothetical protein
VEFPAHSLIHSGFRSPRENLGESPIYTAYTANTLDMEAWIMGHWITGKKLLRATLLLATLVMLTTGCSLFTEEDEETDLYDAGEHYVSSTSVAPGDMFHVQFNIGCWNEFSMDYRTAFYLSRDRSISWDDIMLGEVKMDGNWWLQTKRCSLVVPSMPSYPPGRYYVCARIDSWDEEVEEDEDNNSIVFSQVITVLESPSPPVQESHESDEFIPEDNVETIEAPAPQLVVSTDACDDMGVVDEDVYLSASGSYDPSGAPVRFRWTCLSGPSEFHFADHHSIACTFVPTSAGAYMFEVTMDNGKDSISKLVTISVSGAVDK